MRDELTKERLRELMRELARHAPRRKAPFQVYLVGGGSALLFGWRESSLDADLHADDDTVFRDIQEIKESLNLNVEFARPEHFVPALAGAADRHLFIEAIEPIHYYHYDPYSQFLSKVVRGFRRDLEDARQFVAQGLVDPQRIRELVRAIPDAEYARYPNLPRRGVEAALEAFLTGPLR